jgi:hypothetical protein
MAGELDRYGDKKWGRRIRKTTCGINNYIGVLFDPSLSSFHPEFPVTGYPT